MPNLAIIGGGPAGFMTAVSAVENCDGNIDVCIYDKGEPLATILKTGGGRCNLTNEIYDFKELASNYPRGEKFLYSVFSRFGVGETMQWFENNGVKLKTEKEGRVFPQSDSAAEIRNLFLKKAKELNIKIIKNTAVEEIRLENGKFLIHCAGKPSAVFDKLIISTGGNHGRTSGFGYKIAKSMGHTITELKPSLNAFTLKNNDIKVIAGVSVNNALLSAFANGRKIAEAKGDFIFTHKGISGPAVFKLSALCAFENASQENPLTVKINFVPDFTEEMLDKDLLKKIETDSGKSVINILKSYCPKALAGYVLKQACVDAEKKAGSLSREERKLILRNLNSLEFVIESRAHGEEMVTAGGVSLDEINPKTMGSKIIKDLHFCGEILNIDGFTGGFNLQACWSTGYIAGIGAVN